jgi:outer membrane protein OmpA-like peptidoglycan-associated protein
MSEKNNILEPHMLSSNQEAQWISLSDLMTGLMMIFMLIAIAFMMKVEADSAKIKQVAVIYDEIRRELYEDLSKEFKKDLPVWQAEINKDLTVRFKEPEVLFNTGEDELKPKFQDILRDFFPRYVKIITSEKYKGPIQEIRIEGHTSSVWTASTPPEEAYYKNMELSQSRTRSTLRFVLGLPEVQKNSEWLRKYVTANGLSSSHLITNDDGTENAARSQRVEFRIRTDADARIATILESVK